MDTDRLHEFTVVVDTGSLSKAAGQLHCTQSALSKHVASLEHELGCELLERSANGVRPTRAGVMLYGQAARIRQSVQAIYRFVGKDEGRTLPLEAPPDAPVTKKDMPVSASAAGRIATRFGLSTLETQCLSGYLNGMSLEEIAAKLELTRDEVAQTLAGVYRATKVRGKERLAHLVQCV